MIRRSLANPWILLAALLLGAPLLLGRVLAGHDARTYLLYAAAFARHLGSGLVLPAFCFELNGGYGGPGLLLYPPLVHVADAVAILLGARGGVAIGLVALLALFLSGAAMRAWRLAEGDGEAGALAAALVYMAAPYRMADLYERTALSENAAFVFPPLVLLALSSGGPRVRRVALAALAIAGLAMTNLPMLVLFGLALAAGAAARGLVTLADLSCAGVLGAAIAAISLVPAALASRWTVTELYYGGGAPGFRPSENTLFSRQAQLPEFNARVSLALLATGALALAAALAARRGRSTAVWGAVAASSVLGALPAAGALWDATPLLSQLQFPWRLAAPATLAFAALVGSARDPRRRAVLAALGVLAAIPFVGRMTSPREGRPSFVVPAPGTRFPDPALVAAAEGLSRDPWLANPKLADVWYLPRTLGASLASEVFRGGPAAIPALEVAPVAAAGDAPISAKVRRFTLRDRAVEVSTARDGALILHTLAFPGIVVDVDGIRVRTGRDGRTGLVAIPVAAGSHVVTWRWQAFGALAAARGVSVAALAAVLALLLLSRRAAPTP